MLTKTQEQVSRQAKGPKECVEGAKKNASSFGQQVVQNVAIHLWHNANDPSQERSVVRGEPSRYSSPRAPSCCSAQRQLWNMCQQKDGHTCQKNPLQHIFVMGGESAADALTTACQRPCCLWAMCCGKLQCDANQGTCCSQFFEFFFGLVLICCVFCCCCFDFVLLFVWVKQ